MITPTPQADSPSAETRSRRSFAAVATVLVLLVALAVIVRARGTDDDARQAGQVPASGGADLLAMRAAIDATENAGSFTMTLSGSGSENAPTVIYQYQAPDRFASKIPVNGAPDIARTEEIAIGETVWSRFSGAGWTEQHEPGRPRGQHTAGIFDALRSATSASRSADGYEWTGPLATGTVVVKDGFFTSATIVQPAGATEGGGTYPTQTLRVELSDINAAPPIEPPPAHLVTPASTIPICGASTQTTFVCEVGPAGAPPAATTDLPAIRPADDGPVTGGFRPVLEILPPDGDVGRGSGDVLPELDAQGGTVARYRLGPSDLGLAAIESASAGQHPPTGVWMVKVVFKPGSEGIDAFNALAKHCYSRAPSCPTGRLAFVLDGSIITAPTVQAPDFARDAIEISGNFQERTARDLATRISS